MVDAANATERAASLVKRIDEIYAEISDSDSDDEDGTKEKTKEGSTNDKRRSGMYDVTPLGAKGHNCAYESLNMERPVSRNNRTWKGRKESGVEGVGNVNVHGRSNEKKNISMKRSGRKRGRPRNRVEGMYFGEECGDIAENENTV